MRKSVARVLTVISQEQKKALRDVYKNKVGSLTSCLYHSLSVTIAFSWNVVGGSMSILDKNDNHCLCSLLEHHSVQTCSKHFHRVAVCGFGMRVILMLCLVFGMSATASPLCLIAVHAEVCLWLQKYVPLDLRPKKTRAIRKRMTKHQVSSCNVFLHGCVFADEVLFTCSIISSTSLCPCSKLPSWRSKGREQVLSPSASLPSRHNCYTVP